MAEIQHSAMRGHQHLIKYKEAFDRNQRARMEITKLDVELQKAQADMNQLEVKMERFEARRQEHLAAEIESRQTMDLAFGRKDEIPAVNSTLGGVKRDLDPENKYD